MRIGIDLDGVCYDFSASLRTYLEMSGGLPDGCVYADVLRWEFYEDWGFSLDEFKQLCHDGVNAGVIFTHGDPFPGVHEAFSRIRVAGHTIHIVTDRSFGRPGAAAAATIDWLARHDLSFDSITFTADKTVAGVDAMVDDKPENYAALRDAGVDAHLLTRPWNQHIPGAQRVLDLLHFSEVIA
ncbi:5'-nucleotidase [Nocardioides maradonensis]